MNIQSDIGLLYPYIRIINASKNYEPMVYKFNTVIIPKSQSMQVSGYIKCQRGPTTFRVSEKNAEFSDASMGINLEIGKVYDICILGEKGNISLFAIEDNVSKKNLSYGHLRICNLLNGESKRSFFANNKCFAADFSYLDISDYIEFSPGEYEFGMGNINSSNYKKLGTYKMKPGKYNSIFIIASDKINASEECIFTIDAGSSSGFYL